ncbi:MAG: 2-oxoglutarate dehydrogenase E2 component (dihydrolipoamide succinyltransferase) [Hyphomonadaceae bacterium]|nr:MAG: 2-oxoglutarate dehydrogenase E2 component (dihydrolipoamide succinyltransferase) [Hyphomonadaceae bacterium]
MSDILTPALGESVSEATIAKWTKKPGDAVKKNELLVELETDKVTLEVFSETDGTLSEILKAEGETVNKGDVLGRIGGASAAVAAPASVEAPKVEATKPASHAPMPSAASALDNAGISAAAIVGTGRDARVTKSDALAAIAATQAAPLPAPSSAPRATEAREERVRMNRLRQTIARRLKDAQNTAAMLTTFNEVDMSGVMAARSKYKDIFEKKHGTKLGFMSFFVKACVTALKDIPAVNAEIDGTDIIYKNYYDIAVAVGTDKGLVVPVLRDCDVLSLAGIEKGIAALGAKARDGALAIEDMQGGTFTISNGGVYGSLMSTPILNSPQSGILGMHKIQDRVMVENGQMVVRPMMYLALSYDHRIVDGKEAVTFLVRVKECLENPERMLLDILEILVGVSGLLIALYALYSGLGLWMSAQVQYIEQGNEPMRDEDGLTILDHMPKAHIEIMKHYYLGVRGFLSRLSFISLLAALAALLVSSKFVVFLFGIGLGIDCLLFLTYENRAKFLSETSPAERHFDAMQYALFACFCASDAHVSQIRSASVLKTHNFRRIKNGLSTQPRRLRRLKRHRLFHLRHHQQIYQSPQIANLDG